jgi:hypothetical protein
MLKILLLIFALFFLITPLYSQVELNNQFIEENGDGGKTIQPVDNDLLFSLGWTSIATAPEPFGRSIGGVIGSYAYVFGGQANNSMASAYNISTNTWSASTVPTDPGYNCGYVVAGGELYKISGSNAVSTLEKFTPDGTGTGTWTVLAGGPTDVMNAQNAAAWDGGDYIYVHSSNYSTTAPASYLSRYSISGNSWSTVTPTTLIKRYPGLVYHNGFLYLIGGLIPTGDDATLCARYEIATDTWNAIAPLPEAVNFCKWTSTVVGDKIALVGSGGGYSTYPSNPKVFYYDVPTNIWAYDGDTPAIRGLALSFFLPSETKIFFGGGNEGGSSTNYQATCWNGDGGFIPVELISFLSFVDDNDVTLNWSTATEINNSHFEVERSDDGISFLNIASVPGHGTTTETKNYSYKDLNLENGIYYYRLKQVNYDGSFELLNVINVEITSPVRFELSQNYPNPFNPSTIISYRLPISSYVTLKVIDVIGNEVATLIDEYRDAGSYEVEFNPASSIKHPASGIYFYLLKAGAFVETKKMLLLK